MEVFRSDVLAAQETGDVFAMATGCAIDDGAARNLRRQVRFQDLMDVGELLTGRGLHDHKIQVGAVGAAVENL